MKIQTVDLEDVVNLDLETDFETEFVNDFCFVDTIVDLQKLPSLPHTKIKKASDAVFFIENLLRKLTHEVTFAIFLDARLTPLSYACVGVGTSTICPVSMSKIAQLALLSNSTGVILVHNHPDVTKPALSDMDYRCACAVASTLRTFDGMCLYDFVIVSHDTNGHYSMLEDVWTTKKAMYRTSYTLCIDSVHRFSLTVRSMDFCRRYVLTLSVSLYPFHLTPHI